jgi:hypothetical protein
MGARIPRSLKMADLKVKVRIWRRGRKLTVAIPAMEQLPAF